MGRVGIPATAEGAVESHQISDHEPLGHRQFILAHEEGSLGVEDILEISQTRGVLGQDEIEGALGGVHGPGQVLAPLDLLGIGNHRVLGLFESDEHRLLVPGKELVRSAPPQPAIWDRMAPPAKMFHRIGRPMYQVDAVGAEARSPDRGRLEAEKTRKRELSDRDRRSPRRCVRSGRRAAAQPADVGTLAEELGRRRPMVTASGSGGIATSLVELVVAARPGSRQQNRKAVEPDHQVPFSSTGISESGVGEVATRPGTTSRADTSPELKRSWRELEACFPGL